MAKTSLVYRNLKRVKMSEKYSNARNKCKEIIMSKETSMDEKMQALFKLQEMPRNSAKVRIRNRCRITGRPRGYYRKFDLARNELRDMASFGEIPGLKKSSW
ncbi:MAG: 30S ribosomal protein S14 [Lactobacillus sp.]|jgi:small subunit ribosomal protein S14|nr:30S ribosomal protein S14 [Lactobacillus sp.]